MSRTIFAKNGYRLTHPSDVVFSGDCDVMVRNDRSSSGEALFPEKSDDEVSIYVGKILPCAKLAEQFNALIEILNFYYPMERFVNDQQYLQVIKAQLGREWFNVATKMFSALSAKGVKNIFAPEKERNYYFRINPRGSINIRHHDGTVPHY